MAPIVNGLAPKYEDRVAIRMYNLEQSQVGNALAEKFGVKYVPTFVFVDAEGNVVDMIIGETSEAQLKQALDRL